MKTESNPSDNQNKSNQTAEGVSPFNIFLRSTNSVTARPLLLGFLDAEDIARFTEVSKSTNALCSDIKLEEKQLVPIVSRMRKQVNSLPERFRLRQAQEITISFTGRATIETARRKTYQAAAQLVRTPSQEHYQKAGKQMAWAGMPETTPLITTAYKKRMRQVTLMNCLSFCIGPILLVAISDPLVECNIENPRSVGAIIMDILAAIGVLIIVFPCCLLQSKDCVNN